MKKLVVILLLISRLTVFPQVLTVEISGIRSDKGVIQLSVFCDQESFSNETPRAILKFTKEGLTNGSINLTLSNLPYGKYGIALIDDTNENGKIDYRGFFPCEGFGFSNYHKRITSKPSFESFSFEFSENRKKVKIEVLYLKN
ncbi:MAG TPA: DUF2141 domain-containing protein [Prolixibacteraceae bacterium]|nr:DUF2141 domain-containing protein [Bacteroidales bacterium]HQN94076.1 DUF2141 domain-containing protein [Prolixibacteraceae bacterium]